MNYEKQDSSTSFMSNLETQCKLMSYASMLNFEMLHHHCLKFHALEHLKPCVKDFERIDQWLVHVARSICGVSISGVHFHHKCKWVLHLHCRMKNEVARQGYFTDNSITPPKERPTSLLLCLVDLLMVFKFMLTLTLFFKGHQMSMFSKRGLDVGLFF